MKDITYKATYKSDYWDHGGRPYFLLADGSTYPHPSGVQDMSVAQKYISGRCSTDLGGARRDGISEKGRYGISGDGEGFRDR